MIQDIAHLGLLEDETIELDVAALELAALDHPGVDLVDYLAILDDMQGKVADFGRSATSPREQANILSEVIGGEFGFTGDSKTYDDSANADLICVIDRRRGLPVSLSILYVALARRAGWEAYALNTPGHVLVQLGEGMAPVLIDPFGGGALVETRQVANLLANVGGGGAESVSEQLAPMTNRLVLVRLLMNQATRAEAAKQPQRALTLYARMTTIAPAYGQAWWERARLELADGGVAEARASLSAMLEITRDAAVRGHVKAAMEALAGSSS